MKRAALLLEVVVAMTVLVAALGLLGAQLARSLDMVRYAEDQLRASQLTERLLALVEFDPNVQQRLAEAGLEWAQDAFGKDTPGYFWRVKAEPVDKDDPNSVDLGLVTLQVLFQPDGEHPDTIDGAQVVRQVAFLKAKPAQIDLQQMGLTPEALGELALPAELAGQLPDLLAALGGFESGQVSIQQIVQALDTETLQIIMPVLQTLLARLGTEGQSGDLGALAGELGTGGPFPPGGPPMAGPGGAPFPPRRPGMPGMGPREGPAPGGPPATGGGPGPGGLPVRGSGPNGEFTIEDLMRLRDEMARREGVVP